MGCRKFTRIDCAVRVQERVNKMITGLMTHCPEDEGYRIRILLSNVVGGEDCWDVGEVWMHRASESLECMFI